MPDSKDLKQREEAHWAKTSRLMFTHLAVWFFFGFLIADVILIAIIGASIVRRFYKRHELAIVRMSGLLFMGFAVQAIWHAAPGLAGWRRA